MRLPLYCKHFCIMEFMADFSVYVDHRGGPTSSSGRTGGGILQEGGGLGSKSAGIFK